MKSLIKTILLTGLFVGTTDIIAAVISAWIRSGTFPFKVFQYIAGGALGLERSMAGGWEIALLGLFFHYFIAMAWTVLFFLALPRIKLLWFNKYLVGFLYGVLASMFMGFVVLPLTPLPQYPFNLQGSLIGWSILGVVLGIPVAISAYRFYAAEDVKALSKTGQAA